MTLVRSLLDHPGPTVVALQRRVTLALIAAALGLAALGRAIRPR